MKIVFSRIPEEESFFKGHIPVIANTAQANITLCTCVEDEGTAIQCGPVPEDDCGQSTIDIKLL